MTTLQLAKQLICRFSNKGITVATAESCTGGLIAKTFTDISGSSAVFCGGFVTYTNEAKRDLLGVDEAIFAHDTEVSHACAKAMAEGARLRLGADVAVSTTGFAGPTGGTAADPVGTVYIGISTPSGVHSERFCAPIGSTRREVRAAATKRVLEILLEM